MNREIYKKLVIVVLGMFMLYSTGLVNVFADFWRTVGNTFENMTNGDQSNFKYGYGYGNLGWGYGYGYGYGYGSYQAGYMISNSTNGQTISIPTTSLTTITNVSSVSIGEGTSKSLSEVVSTLLGTSISEVKQITLTTDIKNLLDEPVIISGTEVDLTLPTDLVIYAASGSVVPEIKKEAKTVTATELSSVISNSSIDVKAGLELGDPNVVLIFNKPVEVKIANVGTSVNRMCYKLSGKTAFSCETLTSPTATLEVGGEIAYLSGSDLIIKTYHFTTFAAVTATENTTTTESSSTTTSTSGGGGGGGGGWYNSNTDNQNNGGTTTTTYTLSQIKSFTKSVKFTTAKFKKLVPILNSLVKEEFDKSYFIAGQKLTSKMGVDYYYFLVALKDYEAKKISKVELKKKAQPFLKDYNDYKKQFNKVVKVVNKVVKYVKVKFYDVTYKNEKLGKLVNNTLDKLVIKELNKSKYTKSDVKKFTKSYNKFKLAVKYMKEVNKTVGKKYAKDYVKEMMKVLTK